MRVEPHQSLPDEVDLLVIGGGPGGSSAGLAAARLGLRVLIVEQARFPRHRLGETLPPKILPILSFLGVLPAIEAAGFLRMNGNTNLLGPELVIQSFTRDGAAFGFQVERDRFDPLVLDHAEREGCWISEETSVTRLLLERPYVRGAVVRRSGRAPEEVRAAFVIDASGAAGFVARALELKRPEPLRTTALWGYWRETSEPTAFPAANTMLEATPEGWIWSLPLSDGRRNVTCCVDADTARPGALDQRYREVLASSRLLGPILRDATPSTAARGYDATWYSSRHYAGDGYLLVGEAASFIDPLTSQGVLKAMNSGILAAAAANTAIRRPADRAMALEFYGESEARTLADYRRSAIHLYRNAAFGDSSFWRRRHRSEEDLGGARLLTDEERTERLERYLELLRTATPARLRLTLRQGLRIADRACLSGGFVERRMALIAADEATPPHHSAADLKLLAPLLDGRDLDAIFEAYARSAALPRTPESARGLAQALGRMVEDGLVEVSVSE